MRATTSTQCYCRIFRVPRARSVRPLHPTAPLVFPSRETQSLSVRIPSDRSSLRAASRPPEPLAPRLRRSTIGALRFEDSSAPRERLWRRARSRRLPLRAAQSRRTLPGPRPRPRLPPARSLSPRRRKRSRRSSGSSRRIPSATRTSGSPTCAWGASRTPRSSSTRRSTSRRGTPTSSSRWRDCTR